MPEKRITKSDNLPFVPRLLPMHFIYEDSVAVEGFHSAVSEEDK